MNSRDIPDLQWEEARASLIVYFRRRGFRYPDDLAQSTLLAFWGRNDYEFASRDDFLRICYAFARNIVLEGRRQSRTEARSVADVYPEAASGMAGNLRGSEVPVFLRQVLTVGRESLSPAEWDAVRSGVGSGGAEPGLTEGRKSLGSIRVLRLRARNKLADLTGWNRRRQAGKAPGRSNRE